MPLEEALSAERLFELACRADRTGTDVFTPFLSPPEAALARIAAKKTSADVTLYGGYEGAEREMARFGDGGSEFPLTAIEITWRHADAPSHRDILGSVMALGVKRNRIGDIAVQGDRAYLFCQSAAAELILSLLTQANKSPVHVTRLDEMPIITPPKGREITDTVLSPRLDAVLASAFSLSRARAAEAIRSGSVKLRHIPTVHPDAHVEPGDAISVRGMGRARLDAVGAPTKKGRLPITITRFDT